MSLGQWLACDRNCDQLYGREWLTVPVSGDARDLADHVLSFHNLAEDRVLAIEGRVGRIGDEELACACVSFD